MSHRVVVAWAVLFFGIVLISSMAFAQNIFEQLVMPGDLIEGHKKLEKQCSNCHEPFSKISQTRLCLDCHKDVASDLGAKKGFHGRSKSIATTACKSCHTDHKGRQANIVPFDAETFDHNLTDFTLKGAHQTTPCASCHKPKVKYRAAPSQCVDCHKAEEPHKGRLGTDCAACHTNDSWQKTKTFDHSKTAFPLEDAHKKVRCRTCHAAETYKDLATACVECHRQQDVHGGQFGSKCQTCHQPTTWKTIRFDHARETKFPLRGNHAKAKCDTCHTGDLYNEKLDTVCSSCHTTDDAHKGQLGVQCANCHNETGWRENVAFDHDITRFPLIGLHAGVPCEACHTTTAFRDTSMKCQDCHKDAYHKGRVGSLCETCHNPNGWEFWTFNHDIQTTFTLTGSHAGLDCHACHRKKRVERNRRRSTCYDCHENDDAHRGGFGKVCDQCHTTDSFSSNLLRQ